MLTLPLVAILFIACYGQYEGNVENLSLKFQAYDPFPSSVDGAERKLIFDSTAMIWTRSLAGNMVLTVGKIQYYLSHDVWRSTRLFLVVGLLWFYMHLFIKAFGGNVLMLAPLSIFPMFLLGFDFHRWGALAVTNIFIVSLVMIKMGVINVHAAHFSSKRLLWWGKLLFLLGPSGVVIRMILWMIL